MTNILISYTLEDAKGYRASLPIYGQFDGSTATLLQIEAYINTMLGYVDRITDAKVVGVQASLVFPVPTTGIKTVAVASSDIQETGLFICALTNLPSKTYSVDVPGIANDELVGDLVNLVAGGDPDDFAVALGNHSAVIIPTNDIWSTYLEKPVKAKQTFRKHRR